MLNNAIEAFNSLAKRPDKDEAFLRDLGVIRQYLADQSIRANNEASGLGYLNREMDIVNNLKNKGL